MTHLSPDRTQEKTQAVGLWSPELLPYNHKAAGKEADLTGA